MPDLHGFDARFVLLMVCGLSASRQRRRAGDGDHRGIVCSTVPATKLSRCRASRARDATRSPSAEYRTSFGARGTARDRRATRVAPCPCAACRTPAGASAVGMEMRNGESPGGEWALGSETREPNSREKNRGEHAAKLRIL